MNNNVVQTRMLVILGIVSLLFLAGCGGSTASTVNNQPPPSAGVAVSPTSATVQAGGMEQFTAIVSPSEANQTATWSVSGTGCTGASCGIIDATGKYTAPATVPNPPNVVVAVRSVADSTRAATATVTIINAPSPFSLNPTSLPFGNQTINTTSMPRTATLTNTGNAAMSLGSVAINGLNFTDFAQTNNCPSVMAAGASCTFSVTFTPTAPDDRVAILVINDESNLVNLTGTGTTMTTSSNNAKLSGQYAFLFSGFNSAGPMSVAGGFTADGNGNLIVGNTDVATVAGTRTNQGLTQSSYSVGSDNSGTMRLNTAVNYLTGSFSFTFSFVLDSFSSLGVAAGGRLIEPDRTGQTGTGFFAKQDPAAFSSAAINGGYAFGLSAAGTGLGSNLTAVLGRLTASNGLFSAGQVDLLPSTPGPPPADQPFAGTYSVDGTGRGEAALNISSGANPSKFVLYVVSSGESIWMDTGGSGATGMALQQSSASFTTNSLKGISVFGAAGGGFAPGNGYEQNDVNVGEFQFDGMGNLTVTSDENYFGIPMPGELINGTYAVDSNGLGRAVMNYACGSNPFYLVTPGKGFILTGCDVFQFGIFEAQTGAPFSNASFSGNYALGTLPFSRGLDTSFVAGELTADGAGNVSGTSTTATSATAAAKQTFTGTYSVDASGRVTLAITPNSGTPSNMVFYLISPSKAAGTQMDLGMRNAAVNVIEK